MVSKLSGTKLSRRIDNKSSSIFISISLNLSTILKTLFKWSDLVSRPKSFLNTSYFNRAACSAGRFDSKSSLNLFHTVFEYIPNIIWIHTMLTRTQFTRIYGNEYISTSFMSCLQLFIFIWASFGWFHLFTGYVIQMILFH